MYLANCFLNSSAVDCFALPNPTNGEVDFSEGTTLGFVAYYSCDTCYMLVGVDQRTCGPNGLWSGSEPTCESKYFPVFL